MNQQRYSFASLTRISNLPEISFSPMPLSKAQWSTGDYVVGEVNHPRGLSAIELANGRMIEVAEGDLVVGAFGQRCATLEAVGGWRDIGDDLQMEALTPAGLFGKVTSKSAFLPALLCLTYRGHVTVRREGRDARLCRTAAPASVHDSGRSDCRHLDVGGQDHDRAAGDPPAEGGRT